MVDLYPILRHLQALVNVYCIPFSPLHQMEMSCECMQGVVKRFFNEKEVTSTLVMDALFSGCKQLEELGRNSDSKRVRISPSVLCSL